MAMAVAIAIARVMAIAVATAMVRAIVIALVTRQSMCRRMSKKTLDSMMQAVEEGKAVGQRALRLQVPQKSPSHSK